MSNAVANISAALGYDAVEMAIVSGSLADAMLVAAYAYSEAPLGDDTAPESCRTLCVTPMISSVETIVPSAR